MSFGSSDTPPPAPDYGELAQQQGVFNERAVNEQTIANRPTINTPWATQSWEMTPGGMTFDQASFDRDTAAYNDRLDKFFDFYGDDRTVDEVRSDSGGKRLQALFNQYDPGTAPDRNSEVYTYNAPDTWTQNTKLNPELQAALDQQLMMQRRRSELAGGMTERLFDAYKEPFSFGDIPELPGDMEQIRTDTYNKLRALSDPYTERENAALESSLANKGLTMGSEQWQTAKQQRGDELNRADLQRQLTALREGRAEADAAIRLRDNAINSQLLERSVPLNEMNAILSGQQVQMPQMPGFQAAGKAAPVDIYGAAKDASDYNADLFNYGQTQDAQNTQAATQAASTAALMYMAFAFSDARLKNVIKRIGATERGTPLYLYQFKNDPEYRVGVLAQEAPPHAVRRHPSGYLMVNYAEV